MTKTINVLSLCIFLFISNGSKAKSESIFDQLDYLLITQDDEKLKNLNPVKYSGAEENVNTYLYPQLGDSTLPEIPDWYWADLGTAIGVGVLDVADFNGDGQVDLITTGGGQDSSPPRRIFILANDLTTVMCSAGFNELPFDYKITQLDDDQALEILMVMESRLISMDGRTCEFEVIQEFGQSISAAAIGDVNNDNVLDIVYLFNNKLFVSPWNNFGDTYFRNGLSGFKIIVNSLGREGGDDIGVLSDDVLFILNGSDLTTITKIEDNLTPMFAFGDVNGDDSYELIQASQAISNSDDTGITVTNIELNQVLFHYPVLDTDVIRILDIDDDNRHEILVGEGQHGNVFILDSTGEKIIEIEDISHGTTNLIVADMHKGAGKELIWGSGHSSSGSDHLYRASVASETISWRSNNTRGPHQLSMMGDYLNNGNDYIGLSNADTYSIYNQDRISIFNSNTGFIAPIDYTSISEESGLMTAIASANIDQDSYWEICYSGDNDLNVNFITCRDALTSEIEWSIENPNGYIYQLDILDIDNDSKLDLIAISESGYINAYDALTGSVKWQSPQIPNNIIQWGFNGMNLVDNELWVSFISGDYYKLNVTNGLILDSGTDTSITNIAINNGNIYAIKKAVGVGLLNKDMMDLVSVIYPTNDILDYLKVSEDGKNLLAAKSVLNNQFEPILISVDNTFEPWHLNTLIYDAHMPNFQQLILTTVNGAQSYNLRILYDYIYNNGFE